MPTVSRFYGITIQMFYKEHGVPHFHATYAGVRASFSVADSTVLEGSFPARAKRLVREWAEEHRTELMSNWERARAGQPACEDRATEMSTIHDIIEVEVRDAYLLRVAFDDGEVRDVDLSGHLDGPVFEPLRDATEFAKVKVDPETGTVVWPTGADLDPIVVYQGLPPLNARNVETARQR